MSREILLCSSARDSVLSDNPVDGLFQLLALLVSGSFQASSPVQGAVFTEHTGKDTQKENGSGLPGLPSESDGSLSYRSLFAPHLWFGGTPFAKVCLPSFEPWSKALDYYTALHCFPVSYFGTDPAGLGSVHIYGLFLGPWDGPIGAVTV